MPEARRTILIVAGDPSGDIHGASLISALKAREPGLRVAAVGGPCMRRAADEFIEDLCSRGLTGFFKPLASLPFFLRLAAVLRRFMSERRPIALVCIDYYGFNRRVLSIAKSEGIPSYYYISPQVWATRAGRISTLKGLIRRMLVIFPFEEELYRKAGVPCDFVGHPLLDILPEPAPEKTLSSPLRVGLLPGSRASEVRRHLPLLVSALAGIRRQFPRIEAVIFASESLENSFYTPWVKEGVRLTRDKHYRERAGLHLALCSSGTATLENALLGIPMVVIYKMAWPTYAVARGLIRVRHIAMANILAGRRLVPELIQRAASPRSIAAAAVELMENPARHAALRQDLLRLRGQLGSRGASARAADTLLRACPC